MASFDSPSFPVRTVARSFVLSGVTTELVACKYSNSVLLVATQLQTLGTLLRVSRDEDVSREPSDPDLAAYGDGGGAGGGAADVKVLLGRREEGGLEQALARALLPLLDAPGAPPQLILGLGLQPAGESGAAAQREAVRSLLLPQLQALAVEVLA